jgi:DNA primase catalytic core
MKLTETSFRAVCQADLLAVMRARGLDPRPSGSNAHKVQCPFHGQGRERTPSLSVNQKGDETLWHCFACKAGGRGAVDFIRQYDDLPTWHDAAEVVADICGIALTFETGGRPDGADGQPGGATTHAQLRAAVAAAVEHYHANLLASPEILAYAAGRGLTLPVCKRWKLGYAIADRVAGCGAAGEHLLAAGVLKARDDGSTYDPLHARFIIPLHDQSGRPVAFAGRALSDSGPKYINTAESPLYTKGNLLYGLHRARDLMRQDRSLAAITLVEGQLKALACLEAGIPAVAPGGTGLTSAQVAQVLGLSRTVRLAGDLRKPDGTPDLAGIKSIHTAALALRLEGAIVQAAALDIPAGAPHGARDPDDLLAAGLPIAYTVQDIAAWAVRYLPRAAAGSAGWADEISHAVMDLVCAHPEPAVRHVDTERVADLTGIPAAYLVRDNRRGAAPCPARPASPASETADSSRQQDLDTRLTPGRLLCAMWLQGGSASMAAAVPWLDLPVTLVASLHGIHQLKLLAASRRISLMAAIDSAAGLSPAQRRQYRYWASLALPGTFGLPGVLGEIVDAERQRRSREGIA